MNFFGHAVAASWRRDEPRFALGAMLPDFASMLGARIESVGDGPVADGVAWHHRTDAAFHRLERFRRWSAALTRSLAAGGCSRGSSLAAGHVGVELLLDGALIDREPEVGPLYLAALGEAGEVAADIEWRSSAPPIGELASRLGERGLPVGYRDVDTVADRVIRVLARRPRLAMAAANAPILVSELERAREVIELGVDGLIENLRAALV